MALWSAAHLIYQYPKWAREMDEDKDFQGVRLANVVQDLGERWQATPHQQLGLADALFHRDWLTAALVASAPFEWAICQLATHFKIPKWTKGITVTALAHYVPLLGKSNAFLDKLPNMRLKKRISTLANYRNKAVHYDEPDQEADPLTREKAKTFINDTKALSAWMDSHGAAL